MRTSPAATCQVCVGVLLTLGVGLLFFELPVWVGLPCGMTVPERELPVVSSRI